MSDVPNTEPQPAAKGTSPLRLIVLLSIFSIALAGLLYDYLVARPAIEAAHEKVVGMLDGEDRADLSITPDDVQQEIGQTPAEVEDLENGKIEIYKWRSGVPFRFHSLYVVYSGRELPLLFSASQNTRPDRLPPKNTPAMEMSEEELAKERFPMGAGAGAGPGGKAKSKTEEEGDEVDKGDAGKGEEPATEEPAKEEPAKEEPAKEEPAKEEPAKEEPAKEEPAKEEPKKEEPKKEEPKKEEPKKDDAGKEGNAKKDDES